MNFQSSERSRPEGRDSGNQASPNQQTTPVSWFAAWENVIDTQTLAHAKNVKRLNGKCMSMCCRRAVAQCQARENVVLTRTALRMTLARSLIPPQQLDEEKHANAPMTLAVESGEVGNRKSAANKSYPSFSATHYMDASYPFDGLVLSHAKNLKKKTSIFWHLRCCAGLRAVVDEDIRASREALKHYVIGPIEIARKSKRAKRKSTISVVLREQCWRKRNGDRMTGKCFCCGRPITYNEFECSHIVAEAKGGITTIENLEPCCRTCNRSMGTQNLNEFKRLCALGVIEVIVPGTGGYAT